MTMLAPVGIGPIGPFTGTSSCVVMKRRKRRKRMKPNAESQILSIVVYLVYSNNRINLSVLIINDSIKSDFSVLILSDFFSGRNIDQGSLCCICHRDSGSYIREHFNNFLS